MADTRPSLHSFMINDTGNASAGAQAAAMLYLERPGNVGLMALTAATLTLSALLGTFGNILVIGSICFVRSLRTTGNMFILNLALADTIITALVDPFNAVGAIDGRRVLMGNDTLCQVVAGLCAPACIGSLWNMCAISTNRYFLICKPHLYPRIYTVRNTVLICIGIWMLSYLIHLPNHIGWGRSHFSRDFYMCTFDVDNQHFAIYYVILVVVVPLNGVLFGYTSIFIKVRGVRHAILRHQQEGRSSLPVTATTDAEPNVTGAGIGTFAISHGRNTANRFVVDRIRKSLIVRPGYKQDDVKLAKTLFTAFVIFFVSWTPFAILVLINRPDVVPGWLYIVATIMGHGNSAVNPVLYGISSKKFRDGYRSFLGRPRGITDATRMEKS